MKRTLFYILLAAAALAGAALSAAGALTGIFSSALAFPLAPVAAGLRALSLLGRAGNAGAMALWAALGLGPVWYLLLRRAGPKIEDALLGLLSALLLFGLWLLSNPARLGMLGELTAVLPDTAGMLLGAAGWSLFCCWLALRALRLFRAGGVEALLGYMDGMLRAVCLVFVWMAAYTLGGMARALAAESVWDGALGALRLLGEALPWALDTALSLAGLSLLGALRADRYSELAAVRASALARLGGAALTAEMLVCAGLNAAQLLCAARLHNIDMTVSIPLFSAAFALSALLLARLIEENGRLKTENDEFI